MIWLSALIIFLTPLMGRFNSELVSGSLLLVSILYLFSKTSHRRVKVFAPLFGIYLGWIIILFWQGLGLDGLTVVTEVFGPAGVLEWFLQRRLPELRIFSGMLWLVFLIAGLLISAIASQKHQEKLLNLFILSGVIGGLTLILEKVGMWPSFLPKIELHWTITERASGFFTDPNSTGLFLGLLLPFLFKGVRAKSIWFTLGIVIVVIAGLSSGSRTFILALALSGLMAIQSKKIRIYLCLSALIGVTLLGIFAKASPDSYKSIASSLPRSIERAALTLASSEGNDSVESRLIFFNLAKWIWQDQKIGGIGPGQFHNIIDRYEHRLPVKLYGWRDNSNNFYMGILAELGLLGVAAIIYFVIFSFRGFNLGNSEHASTAAQSLLILAMLMILGPHLDFPEVGLLSGFLFGLMGAPFTEVSTRISFGGFLLFTALTLLFARFYHAGLFSGNYHHPEIKWSSVSATLKMPCIDNLVSITISGRPVESEPLRYRIKTAEDTLEDSISFNSVKTEKLKCSGQVAALRVLTLNPFKFFPPGSSIEKYSLRGVKILNYSVN